MKHLLEVIHIVRLVCNRNWLSEQTTNCV